VVVIEIRTANLMQIWISYEEKETRLWK